MLKHGFWKYWDGWMSNHDMRIDNAVCSECGYRHPTVRLEQGDPRGKEAYKAVLNKLKDVCPECGSIMHNDKNTEERNVINSLITIKEYCSKNDTAGKCFCCLMYGLCNRCFKGLPSLWDIKNPYVNKE